MLRRDKEAVSQYRKCCSLEGCFSLLSQMSEARSLETERNPHSSGSAGASSTEWIPGPRVADAI